MDTLILACGCRSTPVAEVLAPAYIISWMLAAGFAATVRPPTTPTGLCATCGYDLAGLAEHARCPECGGTERGMTSSPRDITPLDAQRSPWDRRSVRVISGMVQGTMMLVLGAYVMRGVAAAQYLSFGFSLAKGWEACESRELGGLRAYLPVEAAMILTPIVCGVRRWSRGRQTMLVVAIWAAAWKWAIIAAVW